MTDRYADHDEAEAFTRLRETLDAGRTVTPPRDYSPEDYLYRCSDIDLAIQATSERIDEWDETADPNGWWHERPMLIALLTEIAMLRGELARYREARER